MNKNLFRFLFCSMLGASIITGANAQDWTLAGNNTLPSSKLGTTNNVSLRFYTNNLQRMMIDSFGRVGINIAAPNIFSVKGPGSNPAPSWITAGSPVMTTFAEGAIGNGDILTNFASDLLNARAVILGRKSKGTLAAPAPVVNNDFLVSLYGSGYDGRGFQIPAGIDILVDGAVSPGNVPGKIIFYTGTNGSNRTERLKVGTRGDFNFNSTQLTLIQATGDVGIGQGSLKFSSASQTIQFPAVSGTVRPMITMLPNGTAAASRMVLAPSLASPSFGLNYSQTNDGNGEWDFIGSKGSVMKIQPFNKLVTIADSLNASRIKLVGSHNVGTLESFNYGSGDGVFAYTAGLGGYLSAGLSGEAAGLGAGIHGEAIDGAGVDAYSLNGIGMGGTSGGHYGIYGYTENSTTFAGYFDGDVYASGTYQSSDRKLKKDITDLSSAMKLIKQLKPRTYEFRQDGNFKLMNLPKGMQYGLIAQELEEVLPNLVKQSQFDPRLTRGHSKTKLAAGDVNDEKIDFKAVNYTELIPIMIKGLQEQNVVIEEQKAKMEAKEKEVEDIKLQLEQLKSLLISKGIVQEKEITQTKVKLSTEAQLEQNVPNPPVGNATTISYNIPRSSSKSEIVFTDLMGKKVKQISLNNTGKGVLSVDTVGLTAGTYSYSLFVDGRLVETKKMVIAGK